MAEKDAYCFACGKGNPVGLKLDFSMQEGKCVARKEMPREYQGYDGIVHGGILTTMLDEAMAKCLILSGGERAVTAKLEVRYRHPAPVGDALTVSGWEESRRGHFVHMKAAVLLSNGTVAAEGTAQMSLVEDTAE